jgi:hypothetical protein
MTDNLGLPGAILEPGDFQQVVPTQPEIEVAMLLLTGGDRVYLPITRGEDGNVLPVTLMQAALDSGLSIPPATQFYVDGQQIDPATTFIAPGMVATGVGNVKGG